VKKTLISIVAVASFGLPMLVWAGPNLNGYVGTALGQASGLLSNLITLLFGIAVIWFIWNVIRYSMSSEDEGKKKAREQMIHGIIAIAVMVSIWGIVALLRNAFGTDSNNTAPTNDINQMIPGGTTQTLNRANFSSQAAYEAARLQQSGYPNI